MDGSLGIGKDKMKWFKRYPMKVTDFHIVSEEPDIERWYAAKSNCDNQAGAELLEWFKREYNAPNAHICCSKDL